MLSPQELNKKRRRSRAKIVHDISRRFWYHRRMPRTYVIWIFLFIASALGCASPKVGYDYDPNADFTRYRNYAWGPGQHEASGDKRVDNPLIDTRIRNAIGGELRSKGYTASSDQQPDFYVAYRIGVKDMMMGSSTQRYIGDYAHGTHTTISDIQPYTEGGLLVDIVDAATKQLVWRASAAAEVKQGMTPEDRTERIGQVVHAMFSHFPPGDRP